MAVNRWTLSDGDTTITFKFNPYEMSSPYLDKEMEVSTIQLQTIMNPSKAKEWTFTGNIYTEDEYDRLKEWHDKNQLLTLTDHLLRAWQVVSQNLDITERRNTAKSDTRFQYKWTILNLGRVD